MASKTEALTAELEVAKLEDKFLAAKEKFYSGNLSENKYREAKEAFHAARVAHREQRETTGVSPETIQTKARG